KNLLNNQSLRDHRLKLVERNVDGINLFTLVALDHRLSQFACLAKLHFPENTYMFPCDLNGTSTLSRGMLDFERFLAFSKTARLHGCGRIAATQEIAAFAADCLDVNVLALFRFQEPLRRFIDV